jgi:DNA replication protein DnaC
LEDPAACVRIDVISREHAVMDSLTDSWPDGLKYCRFENFDSAASPKLTDALEAAWKFAEHPEGWLVLVGPTASGKTHLAAAIKNARDARGGRTLFKTVPDLLDYLRATYAPDSNVTYDRGFDAIRNADVLILDGYGAHSSTPWAEEKLFQLLNHRFNARAPTVITTDQALDRAPISVGPASQEQRIHARLLDADLSVVRPMDVRREKLPRQRATRAR